MRRVIGYITVAALLLLSFLGCSSTPKRSGYLNDYDRLTQGAHLEGYWADSTLIHRKVYAKILVDSISIDKISDRGGVNAEDCRSWLREGVVQAAKSSGDRLVLTDDGTADMRLELAITDMTPGSSSARFWAGEFGAGHAFVQVEGRVVDVESGRELVNFSDRRRASGAAGLKDVGGDAGPAMIRTMLNQIASDAVLEIMGTFKL